MLRSFLEDSLRKTSWADQRPKLRACIAAGVFVLGAPMWLGGGGFANLLVLDLFGCALPVLAVAAANLWIVLHRSNVESLFSQLCYTTGEVMPSSVITLAKENALPTLGVAAVAALLSLLFFKLPALPVHGTLFGLTLLGGSLAPGLFFYLFYLSTPA